MSNVLLIPGVGRLNLQRLLFGAGEPGGIWDWSDRSTLFQNVAGTQPVTASGQTVALHLDKSRGLVRGAELLTPSSGPYGSVPAFFVNESGADLSSTIDSGRCRFTIVNGDFKRVRVDFGVTIGRFYEVKLQVNSNFGFNAAAPVSNTPSLGAFAAGDTTVTAIVSATATGTAGIRLYPRTAGVGQLAGDFVEIQSFSVRELPGNHRYQASAGSRPQYVEDETGHYGLFDGVDDFMETNEVDFTATDKMTVWWGGRKLSDATSGLVLELSINTDTNNGAFLFFAPTGAALNSLNTAYRGTTFITNATANSFAAPISGVVTAELDIGAPLNRQRINGAEIASVTTSAGTGNFGNHKLYFGRRAGTSFPANIREYMIVIRGAATATPLIQRVEQEVRRHIKGLVF